MKRFFTVLGLFTILFTLASCQKEQTTVLRATISHYNGDGKVYISNKVAYWHESDQIWINGTSSTGLTTLTNTQFEIVMPDGFTPTPNADLCAVYPASFVTGTLSSTTSEGENPVPINSIGISLSATQAYETDDDGNQIVKAPMVAQTTFNQYGGADVTFHNVCSLLKVMVHPNVFVHTITVSQASDATNHPSLAGTGTITFDEDEPTLEMTSGGSQTITLTVNDSRADGIYYVVIPPYTDPTKLIVTVFDDPQTIIIRGQGSNHTLPGNRIAEINCIEYNAGIFSVSASDKVSFARGNLTGTGTYSFNAEQYTFGTEYTYNASAISTYDACMGPEWFLLSADQWQYLLDRTDTYNGNSVALKARATVNGVKGVIYLPDGWFSTMMCPYYIVEGSGFGSNTVTLQVWKNNLEPYGALFLPCEENNKNHYWTSTASKCLVLGNGNGLPVGSNGIIGTDGHNGVDYANGQIRLAHYVVQGGSNTTGN